DERRRWPAVGIIPSIHSQKPESPVPQCLLRLPLEADRIKLPLAIFREDTPFIQFALLAAPASQLEPIRQNFDHTRPAIRLSVPIELESQKSFLPPIIVGFPFKTDALEFSHSISTEFAFLIHLSLLVAPLL